jgi:hypothetical protein
MIFWCSPTSYGINKHSVCPQCIQLICSLFTWLFHQLLHHQFGDRTCICVYPQESWLESWWYPFETATMEAQSITWAQLNKACKKVHTYEVWQHKQTVKYISQSMVKYVTTWVISIGKYCNILQTHFLGKRWKWFMEAVFCFFVTKTCVWENLTSRNPELGFHCIRIVSLSLPIRNPN